MQEKCIVVTGATGFIGSARVEHLISTGHQVVAIGNVNHKTVSPYQYSVDLSEKDSLDYIVSRYHPARIEHFASQAIVKVSRDNPYSTYRTNVLGTVSVCETALKYDTPLYVQSTDKYYGDLAVANEKDIPIVCGGAYESSKLCQDLIAQSYKSQGLNVTIARSCNVFGPYDYNSRIVPNTLRALKEGRKPVIFRNVLGVRQYIFIRDLMRALDTIRVHHTECPTEWIFNIGTDINMSQEDTVLKIIDAWNAKNHRHITAEYADAKNVAQTSEIKSQFLDWKRLKNTGWLPKYNFEDAIAETIAVESGVWVTPTGGT